MKMYTSKHVILYTIILLHACIVRISSFPHNAANDDMEIITVEEIVHPLNETKIPSARLITQNNEDNNSDSSSSNSAQNDASNEPMIDIADDLIFLAELAQQQNAELKTTQQTTQQLTHSPSSIGTSQQIDLLTSAEEDSLKATLGSSASSKSSEEQNISKATKDTVRGTGIGTLTFLITGNGWTTSATTPQIELRMRHVSADNTEDNDDDDDDIDNDDDTETADDDDEVKDDSHATESEELDVPSVETPITPIDMSDFVALIPAVPVKSIVERWYYCDPEVERAYAYLNSRDFTVLRQHIIELPEVKAFLRYLNSSGLDVLGFMNTLSNLTSNPEIWTDESMDVGSGSDAIVGNEIENLSKPAQVTTTSTVQTEVQATTEEQPTGLHGMVENVLEILPQDQILATFFDKLESNEQFSKLVDSIGRPAFAKILHNMQNSPQLRILAFKLHNNGIYITKIVDSLKAYFFLGTF